MDKNKSENEEFRDYFDSFVNGFDLKRADTPLSVSSENDDYIYDYLRYSFDSSQPPMQKSLSWSSTDPSLAYERDCYLSPYACNDLKRLQTLPARPRSVTLPAKSHSSKYLHVTQLQYENRFRSSSLSSNASTTPSHLEAIEERSSSILSMSQDEGFEDDLCEKELHGIFNVHRNESSSSCNDNIRNTDRDDNAFAENATCTPYTTRKRSQTAPPTISITTITNKDSHGNITEIQADESQNILIIESDESQNIPVIDPDESQNIPVFELDDSENVHKVEPNVSRNLRKGQADE